MNRPSKVGRKCLDLFWQYTKNEITKAEMDRQLNEIESKQLRLPMGRRRK